jgi:putative endonuclease
VSWRKIIARLNPRQFLAPSARDRITGSGWLAGWLGNAGEREAARFLKRAGYQVIARRYRTPLGELDLVARDGAWIVFVEVKTRRSRDAGQPFEAVDLRKQAQLTKLALAFLKRQGWLESPARFDVLSIVWPEGTGVPEITHFRHAFEAAGEGQMFS